MKTVVHKAKPKFDVGQRVYYRASGDKIRKTTINKIKVETIIIKKESPKTTLSYIAQGSKRKYAYYRDNLAFNESELYSEEDYKKILLPKNRTRKNYGRD